MSQSIHIKHFTTPLGIMTAGATSSGICLLEFEQQEEFKTKLDYQSVKGDNKHIKQLENNLKSILIKREPLLILN